MSKSRYYILITILFAIISIPTVLSIIFQERILVDYINRPRIKLFLIFFIIIAESSFMKKTYSVVISFVFGLFLLIGLAMKIIHFSYNNEVFTISGLVVVLNLAISAIKDKSKGLIHYLLIAFVFQRLAIILFPPNEFSWWFDVILCFIITLVGASYLYKMAKKQKPI